MTLSVNEVCKAIGEVSRFVSERRRDDRAIGRVDDLYDREFISVACNPPELFSGRGVSEWEGSALRLLEVLSDVDPISLGWSSFVLARTSSCSLELALGRLASAIALLRALMAFVTIRAFQFLSSSLKRSCFPLQKDACASLKRGTAVRRIGSNLENPMSSSMNVRLLYAVSPKAQRKVVSSSVQGPLRIALRFSCSLSRAGELAIEASPACCSVVKGPLLREGTVSAVLAFHC